MSLILKFFLFTCGWSSAFAISAWLRLPNVALIALFVFGLITLVSKKKILKDFTILPITCYMIGMILSGLVNPNDFTFNYIISYSFFWILSYFILSNIFLTVDHTLVIKWLFFGWLFTVAFVCINFFINFFVGVSLQDLIPRMNETTALHFGINRAYGFSTEPGTLAFYLNCFYPIGLYYLKEKLKFGQSSLVLFSLLYVFAISLTGSATAAAVLIMFFSMYILYKFAQIILRGSTYKKILAFVYLTLSLIVVVGVIGYLFETFPFLFDSVISKLTMNENSRSVSARIDKLNHAKYIMENFNLLLGAGPGYHSSVGMPGTGSWLFMIFLESGLVSFMSILIVVLIMFYRIFKIRDELSKYIFFSFIACNLHLLVISTFYHPYFFILCSLITGCYYSHKFRGGIESYHYFK